MSPRRPVLIAAVTTMLLGAGGQALATGHAVATRSAHPGASRAELAIAREAGISAAMQAARSPRLGARLAMSTELAALKPAGRARDIALDDVESGCDVGESGGGGFSTTGGSEVPSVSSPEVAAAAANRVVLDELLPAGNLDGVPGRDVLDFRIGSQHNTLSEGITARSGLTGATLWSTTMNGTKDVFSLPYPDADDVGSPSQPGVLLIDQSESLSLSSSPANLTVSARSGAGSQLWTQTLTGEITVTGNRTTLTNVPVVIGDLHDVAGGHDVLVDVINGTERASGKESGTDQPEVISAVDGSVSTRGAVMASTTGIPEVVPVPDLNGDGFDDLAAIVPGSAGSIIAERGDTGATIWTSSGVRVGADDELSPVGYVSNPTSQDLALTNGFAVGPAKHPKVSLINGSTGALEWTHTADCAYAIGTVGAHRRPAVGMADFGTPGAGFKVSEASVNVRPRDASGNVLYSKTVSVKVKLGKHVRRFGNSVEFDSLGDVQPDGAQDLAVDMTANAGKLRSHVSGVISGRNGAFIKEPIGLPADGSLHRGKGTDLLTESKGTHRVRLTGRDGATGRVLYRRAIALTNGLHPGIAFGVRVTGHPCSDLVLNAVSKTVNFVGLFDGNGEPLWTVTAPDSQLAGGTVHLSPAPADYCAA